MTTVTNSAGTGNVLDAPSGSTTPSKPVQAIGAIGTGNPAGSLDPSGIGAALIPPLVAGATAIGNAAKTNEGKGAAIGELVAGPAGALAGGVIAHQGNTKSDAQGSRDDLRSTAQQLGLVDDKFNMTLADGSNYNIGVDGHGGQRDWYNTDSRRPDQQNINKLNAWDTDYTRDIDGVMNVGGSALAMLMYGSGDDKYVRQMGNYFTNATVSNAGTADLTKDSFSKSQANLQGFFKKAGIETKADAYALSNQMLQEGRITQTQAVSIQQGINLAFDANGYQAANSLLEGVKLGRKGDQKPAAKSKIDYQNVKAPTVSAPTIKFNAIDGPAISAKGASMTHPYSDPMEIQND